MNVLVVGAGAVGSVVATAIARAGEDVTLLVRPEHAPEGDALKLTNEVPNQDAQWAIIPVTTAPVDSPDLVILCVKAPDLRATAQSIAAQIGAAPVVALHAAPDGDALLTAALGAERIISGCFAGEAEWVRAGLVHSHDSGLYLANAGPAAPEARAVLQRALPVTPVADLAAIRWALLLVNAPQALAAITNTPLADLATEKHVQHSATALLIEAARVFAKAGIVPAELPGMDIPKLRKLPSMLGFLTGGAVRQQTKLFTRYQTLADPLRQSLRRRRPTEITDLHGALVRLGQQHGVSTPALARIIEVTQSVAQTGAFLTRDKLKAALGRM